MSSGRKRRNREINWDALEHIGNDATDGGFLGNEEAELERVAKVPKPATEPPAQTTAVTEPPTETAVETEPPTAAAMEAEPAPATEPPAQTTAVTEPPTETAVETEPPTAAAMEAEPAPATEPPAQTTAVTEPPTETAVETEPPAQTTAVTEPPTETAVETEPPTAAAMEAEPAPATEPPAQTTAVTEPPTETAVETEPPAQTTAVTEPPTETAVETEPPTAAAMEAEPAPATEPPAQTTAVTEPPTETAVETEPPTAAAMEAEPAPATEPPAQTTAMTEPPTETTAVTEPPKRRRRSRAANDGPLFSAISAEPPIFRSARRKATPLDEMPPAQRAVRRSFLAHRTSKDWAVWSGRLVPQSIDDLRDRSDNDQTASGLSRLTPAHYFDAAIRLLPTDASALAQLADDWLEQRWMGEHPTGRSAQYTVGPEATAFLDGLSRLMRPYRSGIIIDITSAAVDILLDKLEEEGPMQA